MVIDDLNFIASSALSNIALFLSSLITPAISLVGVYHTDVPLTLRRNLNEYEPHPFTTLCHLATAILRVSSLYQAIERRKAHNRSLQEPEWGLNEGREGVLIGLGGAKKVASGLGSFVIEMELRRRSGRSVAEKFLLVPLRSHVEMIEGLKLHLLSDHPAFRDPSDADQGGTAGEGGEEMETTFNLGLTEKQRRDREGIVLPYFDAQQDIGAGEGGRILYEMGREDDFDDEEDEI